MSKPLTVTIDISSIVYNRGVSRYTSNLVTALLQEPDIKLKLFGSSGRQFAELAEFVQELKIEQANYHLFHFPPKLQTFCWYRLNWPSLESFISPPDVFHAWEELIPPSKVPVVATIHDLALLKFDNIAHPSTVFKHQQAWKRLLANQSHVIAVSQATKNDLIELLNFPEDRIHVIHEALPAESAFYPSETELKQVKSKYKLDRPFILFVGTREPRKNLSRLINAWQLLTEDLDLVIVGEEGWGEVYQEINAVNAKNQLHFLGRVSNSDLASLYKMAELFAYPSLYEGFGLPVLEAFFHQTPVLTSNTSSLPEVAGNAGLLVNPKSIVEISEGLRTLVNESSVKKKDRIKKMEQQLVKFSWQKTAKATIKVYQQASRG